MAQLPDSVVVSKLPILPLIMVFVGYLAFHIIIAVMLKKKKEELDNMSIDHPEYTNLTELVKWLGILCKWFPAIATVVIVIGFYL